MWHRNAKKRQQRLQIKWHQTFVTRVESGDQRVTFIEVEQLGHLHLRQPRFRPRSLEVFTQQAFLPGTLYSQHIAM
jgi:hypothetical protein